VIASPPKELYGLIHRELVVLRLQIEGWTNARIAAELVVAPRTVAAHVEHRQDHPDRATSCNRSPTPREGRRPL